MKPFAAFTLLLVFALAAQSSFALAEQMPTPADELTTPTVLDMHLGSYQVVNGGSLMIGETMVHYEEIAGPNRTSRGRIQVQNEAGKDQYDIREGSTIFYLPPVSFNLSYMGSSGVQIGAWSHPQVIYLSGAKKDFSLFVTPKYPRFINNEKWSVSTGEKTFGGQNFRFIMIADPSGKVKAEFPAIQSSVRYGRYGIRIKDFDKGTQTVALRITADEDPTMKGRWALLTIPHPQTFRTAEEMFSTLAKLGGIRIVWEPAPGHPESVEYIKQYKYEGYSRHNNNKTIGFLFDYVKDNDSQFPVRCEWLTDTVLKVSPRDYDKVVAERESAAKFQQQQDAIRNKFDTEYKLTTQIYFPQNMDPGTARELIGRELHKYYLIRTNGELKIMRDDDEPYYNQAVVKQVQENSLYDNKAKAVIVKALPATQEKVATILKQLNAALYVPNADAMNVFQIEAILLRGNGDGNSTLPGYLTAKDLEGLGVKKVTEIGRAVVQLAGEKSELGQAKVALGGGYGVELSFQDYRRPYVVLRGTLLSGIEIPKSNVEVMPRPNSAAIKQTTITLKRGEEKEFEGALFRLVRSYPTRNDPSDTKSDGAELAFVIASQPGKGHISELETQLFGEYEVTAEDISPVLDKQGSSNGDGTVRLRVRHIPQSPSTPLFEPKQAKAQLLENTVFLERDKPTLLGLTNMREALILVLRWKDK